ncbi:hypothetical protein [Kitasatospora purpeofusca]|uniref:hypothetical protein n=1 Tax=Kitasatospora purpeofusca TaxID=67352 RepID=UPI0036CE5E01
MNAGLKLLLLFMIPLFILVRAGVRGYEEGLLCRLPAKVACLLVVLPLAGAAAEHYADENAPGDGCLRWSESSTAAVGVFLAGFCLVVAVNRRHHVGPKLSARLQAWHRYRRIERADRATGAVAEVLTVGALLAVLYMGSSPLVSLFAYPAQAAGFVSGGIVGGAPEWMDLIESSAGSAGFSSADAAQNACPSGSGSAGPAALLLVPLLAAALVLALDPLANSRYMTDRLRTGGYGEGPHACAQCRGYGVYVAHVLVGSLCLRCNGTGLANPRPGQWPEAFTGGTIIWAWRWLGALVVLTLVIGFVVMLATA